MDDFFTNPPDSPVQLITVYVSSSSHELVAETILAWRIASASGHAGPFLHPVTARGVVVTGQLEQIKPDVWAVSALHDGASGLVHAADGTLWPSAPVFEEDAVRRVRRKGRGVF